MAAGDTDVFIRCYSMSTNTTSPIRMGMAIACIERWKLQPGINLTIMYPVNEQFHMEGKQRAELQATSDIYIVADDDCLLLDNGFVERGTQILAAYPEYGMASGASISDGFANLRIVDPPPMVHSHSVGGITFIRKGILKLFTPCNPEEVDTVIHKEMSDAGYESGIMPGCKYNHLGCGYSLTNKGYWSV